MENAESKSGGGRRVCDACRSATAAGLADVKPTKGARAPDGVAEVLSEPDMVLRDIASAHAPLPRPALGKRSTACEGNDCALGCGRVRSGERWRRKRLGQCLAVGECGAQSITVTRLQRTELWSWDKNATPTG